MERYIEFEHRYTIDSYITISVSVKSGEFSGATSFCIPSKELQGILAELNAMYSDLSGCCRMRDSDSDDFVLFEYEKYGHIQVSGQLGGSYNDQFVKFTFQIDQTELLQVIEGLEQCL